MSARHPENGRTPLGQAALLGNTEVGKFLIEKGARVSGSNRDGNTPLHVAAFLCEFEFVALLLKHGADPEVAAHIKRMDETSTIYEAREITEADGPGTYFGLWTFENETAQEWMDAWTSDEKRLTRDEVFGVVDDHSVLVLLTTHASQAGEAGATRRQRCGLRRRATEPTVGDRLRSHEESILRQRDLRRRADEERERHVLRQRARARSPEMITMIKEFRIDGGIWADPEKPLASDVWLEGAWELLREWRAQSTWRRYGPAWRRVKKWLRGMCAASRLPFTIETFRENLSHGSGPVWLVIAPEHPDTVGGWGDRPEHAAITCLTGNGPLGEANADAQQKTSYSEASDVLVEIQAARLIGIRSQSDGYYAVMGISDDQKEMVNALVSAAKHHVGQVVEG